MASSHKKRQTMAKFTRERAVAEKRMRKQEKKEEKKQAAAAALLNGTGDTADGETSNGESADGTIPESSPVPVTSQ